MNLSSIALIPMIVDMVDYIGPKTEESFLEKFATSLRGIEFNKIAANVSEDYDEQMKYHFGLTNKDKELNGFELLEKYGYHPERYSVETDDGYFLELARIAGAGCAVLVVHGILTSFEDYLSPGPGNGLIYLLADAGYDVYFLDCRGSKFSQNHTTYKTDNPKYWDFSWHEIGTKDLPAAIDKVLEISRKDRLIYIGHSQGTTAVMVMLSECPSYNNKISVSVFLAPVAFMDLVSSPIIRALSPFWRELYFMLHSVGQYQILPSDRFTNMAKDLVCGNTLTASYVCSNFVALVLGFDPMQVNFTSIPVEFNHGPAPSSVKQAIHYMQMILSGKFRQYDYEDRNPEYYNATEPPEYDLSAVTAPVALFYSGNDWLVHEKSVRQLRDLLPNVVLDHFIEYEFFNHLDHLWAKDVKTLVYDKVFELLLEYCK